MRLLASLVAAMMLSGTAGATNLVTNGDFESGNTAFTSAYAYSPGVNSTEGQYTVRPDPQNWNGAFAPMGDHTTGSGNMMVVNGSPTKGDIVWQSGLISLASATDYFFEAFVMNLCCGSVAVNPPVLTFSVSLDGGSAFDLATNVTPSVNGVWTGLSNQFNTGTATSARLFLVNANDIRQGNDFAIDDINLDTRSIVLPSVPEPETWAMMLLGFGFVGAGMRSQRARLRHSIA